MLDGVAMGVRHFKGRHRLGCTGHVQRVWIVAVSVCIMAIISPYFHSFEHRFELSKSAQTRLVSGGDDGRDSNVVGLR